MLNIYTFYTTGPDESRAWFINQGDTAVQVFLSSILNDLLGSTLYSYRF